MRRLGQESQSCWRRQRATYPGGDIQMAITDRLAIDGGTPVRTTPLLPGWPGGLLIGEEEKAAVLEVIESQSLFRHYGPGHCIAPPRWRKPLPRRWGRRMPWP